VPRINYIYIDFQNVAENDWARVVGKPVMVTLVVGPTQKPFAVQVVKMMLQCEGKVRLVQTKKAGNNAADFVLAELIGEQRKSDPDGYIHIVSKDRGFDALIEHLRDAKGFAALRSSFSDIPVLMNVAERVQSLALYFKNNPKNRPGTRKTLEAQIQNNFGKALSPEELAATVAALVAKKVIKLSETGDVEY
jgi:hypothetical protein